MDHLHDYITSQRKGMARYVGTGANVNAFAQFFEKYSDTMLSGMTGMFYEWQSAESFGREDMEIYKKAQLDFIALFLGCHTEWKKKRDDNGEK